jgi:hypothetical protein
MSKWPKTFAWTPGQNDRQHPYKCYPQYANLQLNFDDSCNISIRGSERYVGGLEYYRMGDTTSVRLPADAVEDLRALLASVDTHPKDGDVQQAPLVSGAVAKPDAHD